MGMFDRKAAPKAPESSRDLRSEPQEASQVPICILTYRFEGRLRAKASLIKVFKSMFQIEPAQRKAAEKANPAANFFRVQTSSEYTFL